MSKKWLSIFCVVFISATVTACDGQPGSASSLESSSAQQSSSVEMAPQNDFSQFSSLESEMSSSSQLQNSRDVLQPEPKDSQPDGTGSKEAISGQLPVNESVSKDNLKENTGASGGLPNDTQTDTPSLTEEEFQQYFTNLVETLSPEDYAVMDLDRDSQKISIYTMDIEKVKSIVKQNQHDGIEISYFPAVCSKAQIEKAIDEISAIPLIKNNPDKVYHVGRYNSVELYNVIFIDVWEDFPELEDWAASADYGPIEIRIVSAAKTNPM